MKKSCVAFLLLCCSGLLSSAGAWAQSVYAVSCENVREMRIISTDASRWAYPPAARRLHLLEIRLELEYQEELQELWSRTPPTRMSYSGEEYRHRDIRIQAGNVELRSAVPVWENTCCGRIILPYSSAKDAFAAARLVCPQRVPQRVRMDGE